MKFTITITVDSEKNPEVATTVDKTDGKPLLEPLSLNYDALKIRDGESYEEYRDRVNKEFGVKTNVEVK